VPAGTTIDRIVVEKSPKNYRFSGMDIMLKATGLLWVETRSERSSKKVI
jgi:hypothetical protein